MNWLGEQRYDDTDKGPRVAWMVSYADMMTIILTFMILLLSISTIAQTKYEVIVEEFTGERVGNLHDVEEAIDEIVEEAALGGEIETALDDDGLTIEFSNALLFPTGSAELREEARPVFEPIKDHLATELAPHYAVIIEGYTDDVPIETADFASNWELSTARAIHVKSRLEEAGVDRRRMSVEGYADTRPATEIDLLDDSAVDDLSDDEIEEIRSANRRVVIRVDTLDGERVQHLLETAPDDVHVPDVERDIDHLESDDDTDDGGPFDFDFGFGDDEPEDDDSDDSGPFDF